VFFDKLLKCGLEPVSLLMYSKSRRRDCEGFVRCQNVDCAEVNHVWYGKKTLEQNKRAQRALGRSPEEKVNGQGEAIYRGPPMLSTKYW